jgi:hypothetical protein
LALPWWVSFLRIGSLMSSIPTHVNGFYLRICLSAYLLGKKTHKKEPKYKRHHPKKNVRDCSSVFLCIRVSANKITKNWGIEVVTIIKVGIANIHHTQKGWYSSYNFRFQGFK